MLRVGKYSSREDRLSKPTDKEKEREHSCIWCQRSFSSPTNLKRHQREVQYCKLKRLEIQSKKGKKKVSVKKRGETCEECGKSYSSRKALKVHVDAIHLGMIYPCHVCEKNFSQKSNLVAHLQTQTHHLEVFRRNNDL